jgi:hypothetical protein
LTPPRRVSSSESSNGETRRPSTLRNIACPSPLAALSFSSLVPGSRPLSIIPSPWSLLRSFLSSLR